MHPFDSNPDGCPMPQVCTLLEARAVEKQVTPWRCETWPVCTFGSARSVCYKFLTSLKKLPLLLSFGSPFMTCFTHASTQSHRCMSKPSLQTRSCSTLQVIWASNLAAAMNGPLEASCVSRLWVEAKHIMSQSIQMVSDGTIPNEFSA